MKLFVNRNIALEMSQWKWLYDVAHFIYIYFISRWRASATAFFCILKYSIVCSRTQSNGKNQFRKYWWNVTLNEYHDLPYQNSPFRFVIKEHKNNHFNKLKKLFLCRAMKLLLNNWVSSHDSEWKREGEREIRRIKNKKREQKSHSAWLNDNILYASISIGFNSMHLTLWWFIACGVSILYI